MTRDLAALDLPAKIVIAFVTGLVVVSVIMFVESALTIRWSIWSLGLPVLVIAIGSMIYVGRSAGDTAAPWSASQLLFFSPGVVLVLYGVGTARMTNADLLYFWGPKAAHFFGARAIDVEFLRFPHYYLMHPDYPPLVPLVLAASSSITGEFSYWGALWTTAVVLIAAALVFRGFAAPVLGAARASAYATLLLAILALGTAAGSAAGGADPYLILFETTALSALTFSDARGATIVAAIATAGAAFTKVEGAAFVVVLLIALLIVRRFRLALLTAAPALVLVALWIAFAHHHSLLDSYGRTSRELHGGNLVLVLKTAGKHLSYGAFYLPWLAAVVPFAGARSLRRSALPLLVAAGSAAFMIFFYLQEADPVWWIAASVERVMLAPLMCVAVAAAAAGEQVRRFIMSVSNGLPMHPL